MTGVMIDSLGLEARMVNALARGGIITLEQVADLTVERLISCRGVGPETVRVLRFELDRHNIKHQLPAKPFVKRYD